MNHREPGKIYCPNCSATFDSREEYADHRKYPCGEKAETVAVSNEPPGKVLPIPKVVTPLDIAREKFRGRTEWPCPCPWCGKVMTGAGLANHITVQHHPGFPYDDPELPSVCAIDGLRFLNDHSLHVHENYAHGAAGKGKEAKKAPKSKPVAAAPPATVIAAPVPVPVPEEVKAPAPVVVPQIVKCCLSCAVEWTMPFDLNECPDCHAVMAALKQPFRHKTIIVTERSG